MILYCLIGYLQQKLSDATKRVRRKMEKFHSPVWVPPPSVASYDFCEDYVFDWAICYAIGALRITESDLEKLTTNANYTTNFMVSFCLYNCIHSSWNHEFYLG